MIWLVITIFSAVFALLLLLLIEIRHLHIELEKLEKQLDPYSDDNENCF